MEPVSRHTGPDHLVLFWMMRRIFYWVWSA